MHPPPPSPAWANFSFMMEYTPESSGCHSVCTLRSVSQKSSFLPLFLKFSAGAFCSELFFRPRNGSERNSHSLLLFFSHETEDLKKGQNGAGWESPSQRFLIAPYSVISELFSLPLKDSEGNSESLLLVLFHGTEFRVVFSSTEWFGTEY